VHASSWTTHAHSLSAVLLRILEIVHSGLVDNAIMTKR
jgi:hypothetical protein